MRLYEDQLNSQLPLPRGTRALCWQKGHTSGSEGVECCHLYVQKQSSWMERKHSGEFSKQNLAETFVFFSLRHPLAAFHVEKLYNGKRRWVKKTNPRATTDVHTANTVLLEKVINLLPDACHHCAAWGL